MEFIVKDMPLPMRLLLSEPMNDAHLVQFCAANADLHIERDANGELIVMSLGGSHEGSTKLTVGTDLFIWARADGMGKVFGPNAGFTLPDSSVRAADAAWVSWARWNALTSQQQQGFAPLCPEFVIEVRSSGDRLPPLWQKMAKWIENGVEVAWLIDPSRKVVEISRPGRGAEMLEGATAVKGEGPVDGFVLELGRVWD